MASIGKFSLTTIVSPLVLLVAGCSFFDGPTGPIPGGALRAGVLVSESDIDWAAIEATTQPALLELHLVEPPGSRTTGFLVHDGELYIPCDLGFVWRRVPAPTRWVLSLMYRVKGWHEDALKDGRVVVRVDGKRYERQAVRVTDVALLGELRLVVENAAQQMLGEPLGEMPSDGPNDIWFFRMDPRSQTVSETGGHPPSTKAERSAEAS